MIKTLEVVIAIMILFTFLFLMYQNIPEKQVATNTNERVYEILKLKAGDDSFRDLVLDGNAFNVYDSLYDYIDVSYGVSVCSGVTRDCNIYNLNNNYVNTTTIDYFFYDSNKTIAITTWIE